MEFENQTPFPAGLFRTALADEWVAAAAIARVTYDLTPHGLVPSAEQVWKYSPGPWEGPQGPMDGDAVFRRGGVDLFVFGHARGEGGREVRRQEVAVEVGEFRRHVHVWGDRVWQRRGPGLVPSDPRPFRALPLTLAQAYGGQAEWDGLAIPCPDNPEGKGYYLEEAQAFGQPLPNLEDPDQPVRRWNDRPEPAGLTPCPMTYGPRLRHALQLDGKGNLGDVRPTLFNAAFPRMIAARVGPGDRVRLTGVHEAGPVTFPLPVTTPRARVRIGDGVWDRPLAIDQVGVEVDRNRVFVTYRYPFRYVVQPLQRRTCEVLMNGGGPP